jgi:hypothetical protein
MSLDKAFSVDNGLVIDEDNLGPFVTGGASSPVGQDLPRGQTLYIQSVASDRVVIWQRFGAGVNDWRNYPAQDVSFDPTGIKFNSVDAQAAIAEIRSRTVFYIDMLTTTASGNHNISANDSNIHTVSGTAVDYSVTLPNATLLLTGRRYEIVNQSSETVDLLDFDGGTIVSLISGDTAIVTLEDNGTTAGSWLIITVTSAATGITSYVVETGTNFSTTSGTEVVITGFTVTPVSGRYAVWFSAEEKVQQANKTLSNTIYRDGVAIADTTRRVKSNAAQFQAGMQTLGQVSVTGAEAIDVRVSISGGSLDVDGRTLLLIRLGA